MNTELSDKTQSNFHDFRKSPVPKILNPHLLTLYHEGDPISPSTEKCSLHSTRGVEASTLKAPAVSGLLPQTDGHKLSVLHVMSLCYVQSVGNIIEYINKIRRRDHYRRIQT